VSSSAASSSAKKPEGKVNPDLASCVELANSLDFIQIGIVQKDSEGDKYIELGKKKRATVRSFKDIPLLDIREYYGAGSEEKPGKKGISLTLDQVSLHVLRFGPMLNHIIVAGSQRELEHH
jgi:hypothetical protein